MRGLTQIGCRVFKFVFFVGIYFSASAKIVCAADGNKVIDVVLAVACQDGDEIDKFSGAHLADKVQFHMIGACRKGKIFEPVRHFQSLTKTADDL